ncbi:hypothetical protein N7462_008806 [Penicillium macrosclerotiorum]|uniref:uncharacterized protein n=1 Tax=Penicillium macrosclerotiorum TaxID=303699 RepID=UPI002547D5B7|nr:uncharacterized protein N7462_008806 [Penicillium macrosclerotiorum]KAJ5675909.1 hypothetical protein N7462_008806 [Penicillium macrosclerotiorum]
MDDAQKDGKSEAHGRRMVGPFTLLVEMPRRQRTGTVQDIEGDIRGRVWGERACSNPVLTDTADTDDIMSGMVRSVCIGTVLDGLGGTGHWKRSASLSKLAG